MVMKSPDEGESNMPIEAVNTEALTAERDELRADVAVISAAMQSAEKALQAGEYALAGRYISNALERTRCMYCHGNLHDEKPYEKHYKGYVHVECRKYHGRIDYMRQHGIGIKKEVPKCP